MNRPGLKLICLVLALVIWIQVASTHLLTETLELPVRVSNLREGSTYAGSDIPERVGVRLEVNKLRLMAHRFFQSDLGHVDVDLSRITPGPPVRRRISLSDVNTDLQVEAVTFTDLIEIQVDRIESRMVPVQVVLTGQVPTNRQLLVPPTAEPDSIVLAGPSRIFNGEEVVVTEPVDLGRFRESGTRSVKITSPHPLLAPSQEEVQVRVLVSTVENRTFATIPVIALRDSDQPLPVVRPPVADLVLSGPADSIRGMDRSRIAVILSLSGLPNGIHHLKGQVDKPSCLSFVAMEPDSFEVIIGAGEQGEGNPDQP
jgi:YbbR domain-containing protein